MHKTIIINPPKVGISRQRKYISSNAMQAKPEISLCRADKRQARMELVAAPSVKESVTLINTSVQSLTETNNDLLYKKII